MVQFKIALSQLFFLPATKNLHRSKHCFFIKFDCVDPGKFLVAGRKKIGECSVWHQLNWDKATFNTDHEQIQHPQNRYVLFFFSPILKGLLGNSFKICFVKLCFNFTFNSTTRAESSPNNLFCLYLSLDAYSD